MKIAYESKWRPGAEIAATIRMADQICSEYAARGIGLSLRQLYYQFVSRDLIPNSERSYKNLGNAVTKGRMAGLIDWDHLSDRGRTPTLYNTGKPASPRRLFENASYDYVLDKWRDQDLRIEVWVEKDALGEIVSSAAGALRCGSLACKGYMSASEMWEAGQRIGGYIRDGKRVVILHLGDHDPSGIDMTRDIRDRLTTFLAGDYTEERYGQTLDRYLALGEEAEWLLDDMGQEYGVHEVGALPVFEVERIALNMDQIRQYGPPPNPAKLTDSRGTGYVSIYGNQSWELDALSPEVLTELITTEITSRMDVPAYRAIFDEQQLVRDIMNEEGAEAGERVAARIREEI